MRLRRRGRRRLVVLVGAMLLAGGAALAFTKVQSIQQKRMLAEARRNGVEKYNAGKLDDALKEFGYFFQHEKDDLELNLTFADARARVPIADGRHLLEAIDLYTNHGLKLLDAAPGAEHEGRRREVLKRLLGLYGQAGMRVELIETADRILANEPNSAEALAAKSEALFLDRQFDEALPLVDRLIQLEPDSLNWRRLELEIQRGRGTDPEQLLEICRRWARAYAGDGRIHVLSAALLLEMDRAEEATNELEQVAASGATTRDVLERTVSLLDLLNRRERASDLIAATVATLPHEPWVREVCIRRAWHASRVDEALSALELADRDLPGFTPQLQQLRVLVLILAQRIPEARLALERMASQIGPEKEHDADRAWIQAVSASIDAADGNWARTIDATRHALALSPRDPVLHFVFADASIRAGEFPQALDAYQRSYELDPDWMAAGVAYANALLRAGRMGDAYRVSRMVISRSAKDHIAPFIIYAKAYLALRDLGNGSELDGSDSELEHEVLGMLERAHTELPENAEVATLLVGAYARGNDEQRAKSFIATAVADPHTSVEMLLALAEISQQEHLGLEQSALDRAREAGGLTIRCALLQANAMAARGDVEGGLQLIDQALHANPLDETLRSQARCARAAFLLDHSDARAQSALEGLVADYPHSPQVQQFVLAQSSAWSDSSLVARAMANLEQLLGEQSLQVRLAQAHYMLRHYAQDQTLLAKAMVQLNEVLEQSPDSLAALSLTAQACTMGEHPNLDRAVECLERAVGLYPAESGLVVRLVSLLQRKGEYEKAGRHLRELAKLSNADPSIARIELRLLNGQADFESALARATALVNEASPPPDQLVLAAIECRAGRNGEAEKIYERLLNAQNPDSLVLAQAADFYASTGRFDKGLELIGRIDPPQGGPAARLALIGSFCQRYGHVKESGEWLHKALESDPQSAQVRNELARYYLALNDRTQARQQALEGLKIDPTNAALRATVAIANMGASPEDRSDAIKLLREIGAENDDLLATLELLEKVKVQDGKPVPNDANLVAAKRLVEEHGQFLPAWLLAITLHVDAQRKADAIAMARSAVGRLPGQPEPSQWATQLLIDARRWSEALAEAQEWRRRSMGRSMEVDLTIATILLALNRPEEAVRQLAADVDQIRAERDQNPEHYGVWLRALAQSGNYVQAAKLIEPLLHTDIRWRRIWLTVAGALGNDQAYDALTLIEVEISDASEMLNLALQWNDLGKRSGRAECFDQAEKLAIRAGETGGSPAQSVIVRGAVAEARDNWDAAESLYRRAVQLEPDNAVALNNLAFVIARSASRSSEALAFIERALKVAPDQPDLLDTYGQVLCGLSRFEDADRALSKAREARPDDVGIALSVAELRVQQNRFEEANAGVVEVQRRLKLVPSGDLQQRRRLSALQQRLQVTQTATGT